MITLNQSSLTPLTPLRAGFGLGGGFAYSPFGGIPGDAPNNRCEGGVVLATTGQANVSVGPFSAGYEAGVSRNYSNGESGFLGDPGVDLTDIGVRFGGSIGASVTIYSGAR